MNIHHFQVRKGTSSTAHKPSMKSVRFNFSKRITAASAVFAIILVCTSCGSSNKSQSYNTSQEAVNAYSSYLSEVKNKKDLTSDKLFVEVEKWRVIRDSVVTCLRKDTTSTLHQDWHQTYQVIHDSLRKEFCRVVLTKPRTYNDVLQLKEVASSYMQDEDLKQARIEAQPFFDSLNATPVYGSTMVNLMNRYRNFLVHVQSKGIHSKNDLLDFIKEEDRLFRSVLSHLSESDKHNMQDIIQETDRCCLQVFRSANHKELSHRDALVYMAMRTNRRLILNAAQCVGDTKAGKVKNERIAQAYLWMLVQPYTSLDGLSFAILSDKDKKLIYKVADETPATIDKLGKILRMDKERTKELPALFMKIIVTTF